jgi:hypothetical protein
MNPALRTLMTEIGDLAKAKTPGSPDARGDFVIGVVIPPRFEGEREGAVASKGPLCAIGATGPPSSDFTCVSRDP